MKLFRDSTAPTLKESLFVLDDLQARTDAFLNCYANVLQSLERAAEAMTGEAGSQLRREFRNALRGLDSKSPLPDIARSGDESSLTVTRLSDVILQKEREYKQIIRIVAEAGAAMAQGGAAQSNELKQVAASIESVKKLDSIAQVRIQLSARVGELQQMAVRVKEEGQTRAKRLEAELNTVQAKLRTVVAMSETDALTGLGNRHLAEKAMAAAVSSDEPICLLLFDLNGFKFINDTYGHNEGDVLLKSVAQHLKRSARETDVVCRWGGDEFVILLRNTRMEAARARVAKIESDALWEFVLNKAGDKSKVHVTASVGAAERLAGESVAEFFARADKLMYQNKAARQKGNLVRMRQA